MAEPLTPERLADIRQRLETPGGYGFDGRDDLVESLLTAYDALVVDNKRLIVESLDGRQLRLGGSNQTLAQQRYKEALAQVAALHDAVEGAIEFGDRYLAEHERELCRLGDDTAAAAEAFKRQQRLEGAREFQRRLRLRLQDVVADRDAMDAVLADMTREAK